ALPPPLGANPPGRANPPADLYRGAEQDRLAFWSEQTNRISGQTPFTDVLDWSGAPSAKWFVGGKLNIAYNCVDRVVIYMPMVPEAIVAMLACARLGVMHTVVFGGSSAAALKARLEDAEARIVITTDGQFPRGNAVALKDSVDVAVEGQLCVEHVVVVRRTGIDISWTEGRDLTRQVGALLA